MKSAITFVHSYDSSIMDDLIKCYSGVFIFWLIKNVVKNALLL